MLMLNTEAWTIEGLQVFADHADRSQFWYLPGPVQLARRREDGRAELTFIKVRAADAASTSRGGGFLMFTTDLSLDPDLERRILSKLASIARGRPRLSAAPFDEGTVRVIALDFDSAQATGAAPPPEGGFRAVERALGATVPSLDAVNRASFALTLSQEGAIIIEKALEEGGTPVGVIYELKYSGMRPALDVTITADMSRVFEQFAGSADGQVLFVRGGIDAGFEKLVQDGAIRIEVHDFVGASDRESKETWALNFFKDQLLAQYFTPSLTVGQLVGGIPQTEGLDAVLQRANALMPPPTPAPSRPTDSEPVSRPAPAADPNDSPTVGTGQGGRPADRIANPPAPAEGDAADSPTAHTGHAASAASAEAMGSSAAAGVAPAVTASRPPGLPAGATAPATGAAAPSGGSRPNAVASFRFRGIRQEERKTLSFRYTRSEATQRTYAPQGFVGMLARDLNRAGHVIDVDLDDPFFRRMDIRVSTIPDMASIGLRAAEVALSFGTSSDPGGVKSKDMRFSGQDAPEQTWSVFQNDGEEQSYRYSVQFHFDETSGFEGSRLSYEFGPFETSDRTLQLNPHENLGFLTATVTANKVDWGQIDRIDVDLAAAGRHRVVSLTEAQKTAEWKLRLDAADARAITYRPTFVMKDRSTITGEEAVTETTGILIDDPFPQGLSLQLIPILDPSRTRMAFVDLELSDAATGFSRSERFRLAPTDTDREVRVGLPEGAGKVFRYRVTVVPTSGSMQPGQFIETTETLIAVAD